MEACLQHGGLLINIKWNSLIYLDAIECVGRIERTHHIFVRPREEKR